MELELKEEEVKTLIWKLKQRDTELIEETGRRKSEG